MTKLGVNIDHIATLRNARGGFEPCLTDAVKLIMNEDILGVTMHLREDRRHIIDSDVYNIKKNLNCRLNLEMAVTQEMQEIALKVLPNACCLVPEKRQEVTTEGGLDVLSQKVKIKEFVKPLLANNINVSLFIDPDIQQVEASYYTGAKFIELHTGAYSRAFGTNEEEIEFQKLKSATIHAQSLGLTVNAGHGLNYKNVHRMHEIPNINELNIGHSIISRAVFVGLDRAVKEMIDLVNKN